LVNTSNGIVNMHQSFKYLVGMYLSFVSNNKHNGVIDIVV